MPPSKAISASCLRHYAGLALSEINAASYGRKEVWLSSYGGGNKWPKLAATLDQIPVGPFRFGPFLVLSLQTGRQTEDRI
jgi:hypothetical protein